MSVVVSVIIKLIYVKKSLRSSPNRPKVFFFLTSKWN